MELRPGYKKTLVGLIPEDWNVKPLGEFVALQRGHDLTERQRRIGEVPVMGSAGHNGFHDTALTKGPGVVLGRSGASFGKAHYCETDFWPHNTALYVTNFFGNHRLFAYYFLKGFDFSRHNSGGAQQSLNRNFIAPILVAIPKREEQESIAETLSDTDALIESLGQLIIKKRHIKQGAMQELLSGKRRLPGFEICAGSKQTEVGVIPEDWSVRFLNEIVDFANGKPHEEHVTPEGSYSLITLDSIGIDGRLKLKHKRTNVLDGSLIKGDIVSVLSDLAHGNLLGLCDVIPRSGEFILNQRMGRLRLKVSGDPQFVRQQVNARQTHFRIRGQGTSQKHIYRRDFDALAIPFPNPDEQEAISGVTGDMDREIASIKRKLVKARQIKQGMMQELLTGGIRLV